MYQALGSDADKPLFQYGLPKGNQELFNVLNKEFGGMMMLNRFTIHFAVNEAKVKRWGAYLIKGPPENGTV